MAIGFDCDGSHNVVCTIFSCGGKGSARDENSDTVILFREPDAPINACAHAPLPLLFLSLIGSSKGSEKKDVTHSTWTDRMHRLYAGKLSEAQAGGGGRMSTGTRVSCLHGSYYSSAKVAKGTGLGLLGLNFVNRESELDCRCPREPCTSPS